MSWDDRQRAMLAEMGYRLPARAAEVAAPDALALPDAEPAPVAVAEQVAERVTERATERATERVVERPPAPVAPPAPAPMLAAEALRAVMPSPAGFADLDVPALRDAVAGCRACGLCEQRRHAVYGSGAEVQADWLVVTDPADDADDAAGDALTGDAGRLLDRMLLAAGQTRLAGRNGEALGGDAGRLLDRMLLAAGHTRQGEAATAFVTPIVKCRPPRGRAPQPAELDACEAVLARQVELLRPRLVLAMGLLAARRLTGLAEPLGRLRGHVHSWGGLPLVVTYHPAYLLRSPVDKAGAWDDLCLARRTLHAQ